MADINKKYCCMSGGEKGGVGKSVFTKTLVQYCIDKDYPFNLFETDRSNPDVMRTYGKTVPCKVAIFSEGAKYEDSANIIYNKATEESVIVNLPAQIFTPFRNWIEDNELFQIAPDDGVKFVMFFVSDGGYDSLKLFQRSLLSFGENMQHIFVKNYGRSDDWEAFDGDEEIQQLISEYDVSVIDFPKFIGSKTRNQIDSLSLTFGEARSYKEFTSIARQRVKKFLREAYQSFEGLHLFNV